MTLLNVDDFIARLTAAFHDGDPHVAHKQVEGENVRALADQYRALGAGDVAAAAATFADDVVLEIIGPRGAPFVGRWEGRDRVVEALGVNFSQVADMMPEVHTVTAQGDTVVVVARERGRYLPTGRWYDVHWVQVFRFRDGRLAHVREIIDNASLLTAVEAG